MGVKMSDTDILAYIAANVSTIDQRNPMVIISLMTGQSFTGFTLSQCVLNAVAAGF
jgi:hypothetical protein